MLYVLPAEGEEVAAEEAAADADGPAAVGGASA